MDLTRPQSERTEGAQRFFWAAKGLALATAIIALTAACLLAGSWWVSARARPTDSPLLTALIRQIGQEPGNTALREQARDLDMLARQAYLESTAFRKQGAWLLLASVLVMLGSLRLMSGLGRRIPVPAVRDDDSRDVRTMAAAAVGCFLAFLCGIVWTLAHERSALAATLNRGMAVDASAAVHTDGSDAPKDVTPVVATVPTVATVDPDESMSRQYWPGFRGWHGLGVGSTSNAPVAWDVPRGSNLLWKSKVTLPGFNSPIVWGRRVFVSGADAQRRAIYAYDAATGALSWETPVTVADTPAEPPDVSSDTGYAASTMACDSRHVFAVFANGDLACLDHAGAIVWSQNLGVSGISYGYASSLLVVGGRLLVQRDVGEDAALLAFDAATGKELWRGSRENKSAWCSPIVGWRDGQPVAMLNGIGKVAAYDLTSGETLWEAAGVSGEVASSPASAEGLAVVAMSGSGCLAFNLSDGSSAWTNPEVDAPDITSPVMADGRVFVLADAGVLTCLQTLGGEVKWSHEFDGTFASSPIIAAGRLYLTDRDGKTFVVKAADAYEELGAGTLGEGCYATPAIVGNRVFFRGVDHLFCVGSKEP